MATQHNNKYSIGEIQKHNTVQDIWLIIKGKVYNVTNWVHLHPGGGGILLENAGI